MGSSKSKAKTKVADSVNEGSASTSCEVTEVTARRLVVCAYPGTGEQLSAVWKKMTGEVPFLMTVDSSPDILEIIADVIATPEVDGRFILVPPNCVPCAPISMEELAVPLVFVDVNGRRHFNSRLPIPLSKDDLVDTLVDLGEKDAEFFLSGYFKKYLHRPVEGGFRFGNLVTPVLRANPCENLVIEAFVRKKFVTASPEGYAAITALVDEYLLR